jgi:hypothetical protein
MKINREARGDWPQPLPSIGGTSLLIIGDTLAILRANPEGLTTTQISKPFHGKKSRKELDTAFQHLLRAGLVTFETRPRK